MAHLCPKESYVSDIANRSVTRRRFLQGATATTGALVAGTYVKPDMRSLGVPAAYAAVSAPPPEENPPPVFDTGTPGYWANSGNMDAGGKNLWDMTSDEEWTAAGGIGTNPYIQTTPFNSFFTSYTPFGSLTMLELANNGVSGYEKNKVVQAAVKAARSLIAAYLNAAFYGSGATGYPLTVEELQQMWTEAVQANKQGTFNALNCKLDNANNGLPLDAPC